MPTMNPESLELKYAIYAVSHDGNPPRRPRGLNGWRGYRTEPWDGDPAVPEGWESIALARDPVDQLVYAWLHTARGNNFRRRGEIEAVLAANLPADPGFRTFLERLEDYRKASPSVAVYTEPAATWLGPDPSAYDRFFPAGQGRQALEHIYASAGLDRPTWPFQGAARRAPHLDADTLEQLKAVTAGEYAYFDGRFELARNYFVREHLKQKTIPAQPVATLWRPDCPPEPMLGVACMLKEKPAMTRAFVDYYKDAGFGKIYLYFDDPEDPMIAELRDDPRVVPIPCDEAFWAGVTRAKGLEGRQKICFRDAYARQPQGWMLFCDADEFVWSDRPIAELAQAAPDSQRVIRASSSEPVWGPGQDVHSDYSAAYLRLPTWGPRWRDMGPSVYGNRYHLLKWGLLSHIVGKYVLRCGLEVEKFATHRAYFADGIGNTMKIGPGEVRAQLVHYDALSYPHWCSKLERRLVKGHSYAGQSDVRKKQLRAYAMRRQDPAKTEQLFRQIYCLDDRRLSILAAAGLVAELRLFAEAGPTRPEAAPAPPAGVRA